MRFIDRIIQQWDPKGEGKLRGRLMGAVKLRIQNIADYIFENNSQTYALAHEIPTCAPPWPTFYMEWELPSSFRGEDGTLKSAGAFAGMNLACLCLGKQVHVSAVEGKEWRWLLTMALFVDLGSHIPIVTTIYR
jgi:hypothetical protein